MRLINRGVVIIKARQPFVDWINGTTPDEPSVTLREVNSNKRKKSVLIRALRVRVR